MSILRVDQIQHSNGTAALTIDSSGRVARSNIIAFLAYKTTAPQTGPVIITYNVEKLDTNNAFNAGTGNFTAPVAGLYYFCYSYFVESSNTSVNEVYFRKNGAALSYTRGYDAENLGTAFGPALHISTIEQLSANDTFQVYLSSGQTHGNQTSQFYGFLIG